MPVALTSTSTSPAFGPSSSTVSIVNGTPAFQATAARVFIAALLQSAPTRVMHAREQGFLGDAAGATRYSRPHEALAFPSDRAQIRLR
jgi:hypothetical protein